MEASDETAAQQPSTEGGNREPSSTTPAAQTAPAGTRRDHEPEPEPPASRVASLAGLTRIVSAYLGEDDLQRIRDAYRFSDEAHLGQFRSSGEPYISHPIAVAEICAGWRLDAESLMAALLHDVVEDSGATSEALHERFGPSVAELVDGLSKLDRLHFASREQAQAESFRKMLLAMARDVRVILIKLADRLHNMRTLSAVDPSKQRRVAVETLDIYAPIAYRLGLNELYHELEDLSFKARNPYRYRTLRKAVQAARGNRREAVSKVLEQVQRRLPAFGVHAEVYGREKSLFGIYRKMAEKRISFSQVLDVFGFRIIGPDVPSCYLALGALHTTFKPVPGRFKDYVAIPKINGYQSLHTTVVGPTGAPVEFQIRTDEMNRVAESGVAAHWLYKADKETFADLELRTHDWLKSLLDIQSQTRDSLEFLEHVKVDLFPDSVYVFTPMGKIHSLPHGATVVDFAYNVHTDVGNQAVAAVVNHEPVPLRTVLQNGDVVEVVTDPNARPSPTWLGFVRTGKARSEIRHRLRTMQYAESVAMGRRLLDRALAAAMIDPARVDDPTLERAARDAGAASVEALYADIGLGRVLAPVVAKSVSLIIGTVAEQVIATSMARAMPMVIRGTEGSTVEYSNCCLPVPGDAIIGQMRGGHGLTLHRAGCRNARRLRARDAERWLEASWAEDIKGLFRSRIVVQVRNERGVLGRVAAEIAAAGSNIASVASDDENEQVSVMRFQLQVRDRVHLARVIRRLRRLPQALKIERL